VLAVSVQQLGMETHVSTIFSTCTCLPTA